MKKLLHYDNHNFLEHWTNWNMIMDCTLSSSIPAIIGANHPLFNDIPSDDYHYMIENRTCLTQCNGESFQLTQCDPVNGQWGEYEQNWSNCSESCKQFKERQCNNPSPQYGGENCTGSDKLYQFCNTDNCISKLRFINQNFFKHES